eukprot:TRINITY_DN3785_c0_g1_i4.p1 TRINITY_DN3785_c0_g1~~TRINITY_DN3785_c0_g1_i4.p1  ORF type:complete len:253 (-),score=43.78 TRINITY_DN3785_c0_g1_i4:125-883(-)
MKYMLNFSLGVMLYISFGDILQDTTRAIGAGYANIALFLGMLTFLGVVSLVPEADIASLVLSDEDWSVGGSSKGRSTQKRGRSGRAARQRRRSIALTGILTAIGMSLHNIPEGVAVYMTCLKGVQSGLPLGFAMMLHNIPEGIAVAAPIYVAYRSKWVAIKWALMSGLFEIFGALILEVFLVDTITPFILEFSLSVVAGVMVVLCFTEIVPESYKDTDPKLACLCIIAGMLCIFLGKYLCHSLVDQGLFHSL